MNTLRGVGHGRAPVYARAAILETSSGRPTLDPELLATAARQAEREEEGQDLIVVAADAALALLTPLPAGINLVGVVAERALAFAPPGSERIAVVSGVFGAREAIEEGNLLILDPERGRVLVEPAAEEFAQLQAEHSRRSRVLLGAAHTEARTLSGRVVTVYAAARTPEDLEAAVACGADGLYLEADTPLLPVDDDGLAVSHLLAAAEVIGGGPILVYATPDMLDTRHLLNAATRCRLVWAYPAGGLGMSIREMREELSRQAEDELADGRMALVPALALAAPTLAEAEGIDADDQIEASEVVVDASGMPAPTLDPNAALGLPPVRLLLGSALDRLPDAVAAGARGVAVAPGLVPVAKNIIREQE